MKKLVLVVAMFMFVCGGSFLVKPPQFFYLGNLFT